MSESKILLGFEVDSGKPVYLPLHHLAIFGMTQLSGKTTTLEALINRSGLKAMAFITKRGETGFTRYNLVTPYYKARADWQFVEGLVNVALGEKVKYEPGMRWAIIKVSKGAKNLNEVRRKAVELKEKAKRQFVKQTLEKLIAYLDIIIPELQKHEFSDQLKLTNGINVMDLSSMRLETQQLVIASTIEYAFQNLSGVVVVIPEAWETIPQFRMTPVKWVAEQFIRKGAAIGNYLWLDSQDIGGIDKTPLRQCDNWLMGRMKEAHEVERILKQLLGLKIPKEEIQKLPLGHFYAAIGNTVKKVYVLPAGVPEEIGRKVALGLLSPEYVRDHFLKPRTEVDQDLVWKEKYEKLKAEYDWLKQQNEALRSQNEEMRRAGLDRYHQELEQLKKSHDTLKEWKDKLIKQVGELKAENARLKEEVEAFQDFKKALTKILGARAPMEGPPGFEPGAPEVTVSVEQPTITVKVTRKTLTLTDKDLAGKIAIVYTNGELPSDKWFTVTHVTRAFIRHGWKKDPRTSKVLDQFCQWGFLEKHYAGKRPEYRVKLPPEKAREKGLIKEVKA